MNETMRNQLLHQFDYQMPLSHVKQKGGQMKQHPYVLHGTLPTNIYNPVQRVEMDFKTQKKGGKIEILDRIMDSIENEVVRAITPYVSRSVAMTIVPLTLRSVEKVLKNVDKLSYNMGFGSEPEIIGGFDLQDAKKNR